MVPNGDRTDKLSPTEALKGRKLDMKRDLRFGFCDLVEVPVKATDNNVLHERTETTLAVASTGNINGDYVFFKPFTGGFITRATTNVPLPYSDAVIKRLTEMWINDGNRDTSKMRHEPRYALGALTTAVVPIPEAHFEPSIDEVLTPELRSNAPVSDDSNLFHHDVQHDDAAVTHAGDESFNNSHPTVSGTSASSDVPAVAELRGVVDDTVVDNSVNDYTDVNISDHHIQLVSNGPPTEVNQVSPSSFSDEFGAHNVPSYVARRNPVRSTRTTWKERAFISSQYSRRQAEKKFGDLAVHSKMKELMQMKDLDVVYPVNFHSLTREQRRKIIRSHIIYQPKYDAHTGEFIKLKARFVADGSTQDKTVYGDGVSSPTVSTHAVFINAAIAAKERRIVKVVDLPGAYLNAKMEGEEVLMHINSDDACILIMMQPEYSQYRREDGSMVVKLNKALYGCIESAKLWYNEIKSTFSSIGYVPNPKDSCVFNKEIEGVQCTITLHVDDLMVTSVSESMIDEVMDTLKKEYEREEAKLEVKTGKVHNYLGMTFDFTVDGQVSITMNKYINEVLVFTDIKGSAATPATADLYDVVQSELLDSDMKEFFHSVVAKLLYLAKRVRPDLLTSVGYLAKRVREPTEMDMVKLKRSLRYLNGTADLGLTLRPNEHLSMFSFIDASYAVHHDMKSQTGVAITLGNGVTFAKSTTQQLNSKSSTEAELIALTDASGHVIWTREYLIGQGYPIGPATIYQDNMSTMALVKKGYSTANNTRHINIRYFFIKDRVDNQELKIEYLPTEEMIADFFTKPLQGELFKKLRANVLGINATKGYAYVACF